MSSPHRVSDTEGSERPVTERLRNTTIAAPSNTDGAPQENPTAEDSVEPPSEEASVAVAASKLNGTHPAGDDKARGRPSRKRSHEDISDASPTEPALKTRHGRKRSRETIEEDKDDPSPKRKISGEHARPITSINGSATDDAVAMRQAAKNKRPATPSDDGEDSAALEHVTSPKSKKSRSEAKEASTAAQADAAEDKPAPDTEVSESDAATKDDEKETKLSSKEAEVNVPKANHVPPTSGFANASAVSPFSMLAGSKSPTAQEPPTSAFKSSGFGALAGSSSSGFGSLSGTASKLSSFASSKPAPATSAEGAEKSATEKPTISTFGGALGASSPFAAAGVGAGSASPFGSTTGPGFGQIGKGGFGIGLGSGFGGLSSASKLGSFASSGTPGVIGGASRSAKPFGAAADDEEGNENLGAEDEEGAIDIKAEDDEKDERFFERDIETGEENETTEYTCRAKLYNFVKAEDGVKKEWKERGLGVLRLNVANPGPDSSDLAPKARLVLRADGSHRVALNTPIVKGVKFGSVTGGPPESGFMYFMGSIDGSAKLELLQMKLRAQFAHELYERIVDLQKAM